MDKKQALIYNVQKAKVLEIFIYTKFLDSLTVSEQNQLVSVFIFLYNHIFYILYLYIHIYIALQCLQPSRSLHYC